MNKLRKMWRLYLLLFCASVGAIYVGLQCAGKQEQGEQVAQQQQQSVSGPEASQKNEEPNVSSYAQSKQQEEPDIPSVRQEELETQNKQEEQTQLSEAKPNKQESGNGAEENGGSPIQLVSKGEQKPETPSAKPEAPGNANGQKPGGTSAKPETPASNNNQGKNLRVETNLHQKCLLRKQKHLSIIHRM